MKEKGKYTTLMTKEELLVKIKKANNVAWLTSLAIQRFYVGLAKASIFIVPFMLFAIVINGGIIFDIIMICLYISMFLQMGLQASYNELKVYSYQLFGSDEPLKNTLKSIDLILKVEKEIKTTISEENKIALYQNLIEELNSLYGKGNHLFLSDTDLKNKKEKIRQEQELIESQEKYLNKITEVRNEADKKAKEILSLWFTPVIEKYSKMMQLVRESEVIKYNIEGNKNERDEKYAQLVQQYKTIADEIISDLKEMKRKYEKIVEGVDITDELDIKSQMCNKIYTFAIIDDNNSGEKGLCALLTICVNTIKRNPVLIKHFDHYEQKKSYELLADLGLPHPSVDYDSYIFYCKSETERKAWLDSKEGQSYLKIEKRKEKQLQKRIAKEKQKQIKTVLKQIDKETKERQKRY